LEVFGAFFATTFVAAVGEMLPSVLRYKEQARRCIIGGFLVAFVCLSVFGFLVGRFVISVDTPDNGRQYRSVGYSRTAAAQQSFPDIPNEELLKKTPLNDAGIKEAWTSSSIDNVRWAMFLSNVIGLSSLNFAIGSARRIRSLKNLSTN
jgi:hypothetical protein